MTDSFSTSYPEARRKFLEATQAAGARLFTYGRDDLAGKDGEYLACDVAVLGNEASDTAAIVISGTHGAEGYCGAAILHQWLVNRGACTVSDGVRVVLVHAINPWGFSHKTRATENNIDLNRNFLLPGGFGRANPSYDLVAPYLHGSAAEASDHLIAYNAYRGCLEQHGWHVENESLEGQGTWPDGLFYTGIDQEWSNVTFRRIVNEHLAHTARIGFIDWHTCVGRYGEVVPIVFDEPDSDEFVAATRWWRLADGGNGAFRTGTAPRYEGLLCRSIHQEIVKAKVAGAVLEFGTVDDYTLFRADRMDRWLRYEGRNDPDRDRMRDEYLGVCCPDDVAWRRFVLSRGPELINMLVAGLQTWR